jgi:hypothetical protein
MPAGIKHSGSLLPEKGRENRDLLMVKQIAIVLLKIGAIITAGNITGCSYFGPSDHEKGQYMTERTIEQVQEEHTDEWMAIPGVEGTAIGLYEGKPCIKIFTSLKPQQVRDKIPSTVEGYPVIIEETGEFRALDEP